ncbi:MAG: hypothetical protein RI897_3143 [Verrucomicrobiota bacterium]
MLHAEVIAEDEDIDVGADGLEEVLEVAEVDFGDFVEELVGFGGVGGEEE